MTQPQMTAPKLLADFIKGGWRPVNTSEVQLAIGQYVAGQLMPLTSVVQSQEDDLSAIGVSKALRERGEYGRRRWIGLGALFYLTDDRTLHTEAGCARFLDQVVVQKVRERVRKAQLSHIDTLTVS